MFRDGECGNKKKLKLKSQHRLGLETPEKGMTLKKKKKKTDFSVSFFPRHFLNKESSVYFFVAETGKRERRGRDLCFGLAFGRRIALLPSEFYEARHGSRRSGLEFFH